MENGRIITNRMNHRFCRRDFLGGAAACLLAPTGSRPGDPSAILARIKPPRFPARDFSVLDHGAISDGKFDCRAAIAGAVSKCHATGGGRVVVPPGIYLSNGPIHLAGSVNLHLEKGATILFGTNPADYLPNVLVRWESTRCYNYSPLIYAFRQENIAITGNGTLDGQAQLSWGEWKFKQGPDQDALREMGAQAIPLGRRIFGTGHYLRPALCEFYDCRNVLVEGITLKGSPFWTVHPVFCTNATIRGIHVLPGTTNDDGCDPDSCRDVLVEDCEFMTADDNISIKAGRDRDAWGDRPCENIVIRRCHGVRTETNAYTIGSEMSGNVRNVFILDSVADKVAKNLVYIKSNSDRGGLVEGVYVRGIRGEACNNCIQLETNYKGVTGHPHPSQYRNLHFEDVTCKAARESGIYSVGIEDKPIEDVFFKNINIAIAATELRIANTYSIRMLNVVINGRLVDALHRSR